MKRVLFFLSVLSICFLLPACGGKISNVSIDYGSSEKFSQIELQTAANAVLTKFASWGFNGCDLLKLWYDEEKSDFEVDSYVRAKTDVKEENVVVFLSDFYVDSSGGHGAFNPDHTYINWNWILTRDNRSGKWRVVDWGYP